ncbi:Retrovirus-related Pol polyprotein LINE-1 [Gossypium australe]|uniref:Retrovirus-related Pol polyprotein LINE-1 n=1 Tax=Gossypium australe TaxID=47621 RepID=A0A5B6WJU8_9ROSI|nr:Retrovirus-related Pol polyprotein LINE-1 [Gossypium australe]
MKFSYLQFADDSILFLKADDKEVTNVKYILRVFEIFSGLSINFNKSCLVGFEVEEELLYRMAAICKCKIGALPFNYLGIPLGANPKRLSTWEPIIDRVRMKLLGLKCRSL